METIDLTFNPDGTVKIETSGFKGNACADATKAFEKALGIVEARKAKPEMFEQPTVAEKVKQGT